VENDRRMTDDHSGTAEARAGSSESFGQQFYRVLASQERRRLLSLLLDGEERCVEEVATLLVGWDASTTGTAKGPTDRERAHLRLVHAHLPMLEEAGLVTYDPERGTVRMESLAAETIDRLERSVADWGGNSA
jgi:DNA-binding transcriptional ArsR family regulator